MLGGSEDKECAYSEFNVLEILDKFLEKGLIELPNSRHPTEIGRINDLEYYECHSIISHPIQKCKIFKGQVLQLVKEEKIILDEEDNEGSN